jgi:hypothetical protein
MYSPKINEKHIPNLYRLGRQVKKPMTHLVNEAVTEYLAKVDGLNMVSSK